MVGTDVSRLSIQQRSRSDIRLDPQDRLDLGLVAAS
jgi:hypothetical protein